jgi:tRNA modification GTPase
VQAEAVADLVEAVTPLQARAAFDQLQGTLTRAIGAIESNLFELVARLEASLDFPEEGYHFIEAVAVREELEGVLRELDTLLADATRGRLVREGALVTIVGAPNVGKSSLFNALLNTSRAIVTPVPGTTRDLLTERLDLHGLALSLVDTAGLRPTDDPIEQEGVRRAEGSLAVADLILVVLDRSRSIDDDDARVLASTNGRPRVIVVNKTDLPAAWSDAPLAAGSSPVVEISVRTGVGVDHLIERIAGTLTHSESWRDAPLVTNLRHVTLLERAREALIRSVASLSDSGGALPEEFLLADIQDALDSLQTITGRRSSDDLLRHIFERFCIGK